MSRTDRLAADGRPRGHSGAGGAHAGTAEAMRGRSGIHRGRAVDLPPGHGGGPRGVLPRERDSTSHRPTPCSTCPTAWLPRSDWAEHASGVSVACASGAIAIALAAQMIRDGRATVALAGGSDALCTTTLAGFNALQALDTQPCRPFCETRAGLNIGEAAAAVLLEDFEHARARGAEVLGVLSGWAFNNDAYHSTAPDSEGRGLASCITQALAAADVATDRVGYVNAHGTGTPLNDVAELQAYERAFAGRSRPVPGFFDEGTHRPHPRSRGRHRSDRGTARPSATVSCFRRCGCARPLESKHVDLVRDRTRTERFRPRSACRPDSAAATRAWCSNRRPPERCEREPDIRDHRVRLGDIQGRAAGSS